MQLPNSGQLLHGTELKWMWNIRINPRKLMHIKSCDLSNSFLIKTQSSQKFCPCTSGESPLRCSRITVLLHNWLNTVSILQVWVITPEIFDSGFPPSWGQEEGMSESMTEGLVPKQILLLPSNTGKKNNQSYHWKKSPRPHLKCAINQISWAGW